MIKKISLILALLLSSSAWAVDLTVSAASSLSQAFKELGIQFEAQNPDIKLRFNFAASGALLQQIVNGAPVDVFASADNETMEKAIAKSVVNAGDSKVFSANRLVLVTPMQNSVSLKQLADLKNTDIKRIAMGVPASVPAGHYALGSMEKAGMWAEVKDKIISTQNVRQALDYVVRGEVDAGFVYASDAQLMPDKVKVAFQVQTTTPIQYFIAKIVTTSKTEEAQKFITFVQSGAGQAVLKKFGFGF